MEATAAVPLTASFGVASHDKGTAHWEFMVRHADDALYQAKNTGRNRVVMAEMRYLNDENTASIQPV